MAEQYLSRVRLPRVSHIGHTSFRTGDLLLWSTCFKLRTDIEKIICSSRFTHVSLVFVDAAGVPFVWETMGETGHRLCKLHPLLKGCGDRIQCVLRKINKPLDSKAFEALVRAALGKPYSFGFWKGVVHRWGIQLPIEEKPSLSSPRFCSELVAETYQRFGVLDFSHHFKTPTLVLPGDFSVQRDSGLPWVNDYALGPEIELKYNRFQHSKDVLYAAYDRRNKCL